MLKLFKSKQTNAVRVGVRKSGNTLHFDYEVSGPWREAFNLTGIKGWFAGLSAGEYRYYCTYEQSVEDIPDSIAILPLLGNVMPIAWFYGATIYVDDIDKDYLDSLESVRIGLGTMYPDKSLSARIIAKKVTRNRIGDPKHPPLVLYSGGVDAVFSMLSYRNVEPTLVTLWGADIFFNNEDVWQSVSQSNAAMASTFGAGYTTIKTTFRFCVNYEKLDPLIRRYGGQGWWHGCQHSIAMLAIAAPLAWLRGSRAVVVASSYSAKDLHPTPCGSHPNVDGVYRFFDCQCVHHEFTVDRQDKVKFICEQSRQLDRKIPLRVCWEVLDGKNCCVCDKCMRTIFAIWAERADPQDFGFQLDAARMEKMMAAIESGKVQKNAFWSPITQKLKLLEHKSDATVALLRVFD